ncbi:Retrovirus-related Pol polyprotein from transposon RE2 [Sesamum angolense]|uniref:Retrovirus-related Pol polyprotein from transposon RE2 n=1 Tax=Sesamum angolense TaxID=2727404 RepID=A0AAE1W3N9_9LAMI|nr:Retrovirus-related Pol polyprotein from transposon RE2 [Sesamum angolense]
MEQRRRNGRPPNARVMNVQLEDGERSIQGTSAVETQSNLSALVRTEVMRALQTSDVNLHRSNFVEYDDFADLPQGKNVIGCRWIYKIKLRPDGTIERCKARLVAKGFSQVEGIDYNDCFAPVAKTVTVRLFWLWQQEEDGLYIIWMSIMPSSMALWMKYIYGCTRRLQNPTRTGSGLQLIALLVYVDDILVTAPTEILIQEIKGYFDRLFSIKDLGPAKYFLGLELARSPQGLIATQNKLKFGTESGGALQDPDWAACPLSKITHRILYILGISPVSWKTKKQTTVARSSAEAEYRSMAATTCEITWVTNLLQDLGVRIDTPVPFFCDNKAALHITANPVFHERTKHLEIDCHVVRDKYKEGLIQPRNKQQIVDIFTKSLPGTSFLHLRSKLGLIVLHPRPTCGGADGAEAE